MSDRPAGRGHAFVKLIFLEPKARLTNGLLWWVPPSLLPCMGPMPNHASTNCGALRVLPVGVSQTFRLLFLGNGWADCVEILYAIGVPLFTTALLYLRNGLADCVEWSASARAHVRTLFL